MIRNNLEEYRAILDIFTLVQKELHSFILEVILFKNFMRIEQKSQ